MQKNAKNHKFIAFFAIYNFLQFFELLLIFCIVSNFLQDRKIDKFMVFYDFLPMHQNLHHFCNSLQ